TSGLSPSCLSHLAPSCPDDRPLTGLSRLASLRLGRETGSRPFRAYGIQLCGLAPIASRRGHITAMRSDHSRVVQHGGIADSDFERSTNLFPGLVVLPIGIQRPGVSVQRMNVTAAAEFQLGDP